MRSKLKWIVCGLLTAAVLLTLALSLHAEEMQHAPVTWLSDATYAVILRTQREGVRPYRAGTLRILDEAAPFDEKQNVYYVPQSLDSPSWDLPLDWSNRRYTAYLVPDAMLHDKSAAIAAGHAFTLLVSDGKQYFLEPLVFTGMPMVTLEEIESVSDATDYRLFRIFDPSGSADGGYLVQRSYATYHARGSSAQRWDKKSYRIALCDGARNAKRLSLLGLRTDEDWILNAMFADPQKMRDAVCCDLWNAVCRDSSSNLPYSDTAMTELIMEGTYNGLYCLMEPMGKKGASLNPNTDFLFQFKSWLGDVFAYGDPCTLDQLYKLGEFVWISTNARTAETQRLSLCDYVNLFLQETTPLPAGAFYELPFEIANLIDVSLFAEATGNWDSMEKNAFLLGQLQPDGRYRYTLLPWDCDLSFGVGFSDEWRGKLAPEIQFANNRRTECRILENAYPDKMHPLLKARWQELRQSVYSNASIFSRVEAVVSYNEKSGALARDAAQWTEIPASPDVAPIIRFMQERLAYLDALYAALD